MSSLPSSVGLAGGKQCFKSQLQGLNTQLLRKLPSLQLSVTMVSGSKGRDAVVLEASQSKPYSWGKKLNRSNNPDNSHNEKPKCSPTPPKDYLWVIIFISFLTVWIICYLPLVDVLLLCILHKEVANVMLLCEHELQQKCLRILFSNSTSRFIYIIYVY